MLYICILYGFPCEMDFSHHESPNPTSRLRRGWESETSGEKSISHGKPYKMHFLAYFTLQGTLIILNTLCKFEDHENHVRYIYLTKFCSLHGGRSEVCEIEKCIITGIIIVLRINSIVQPALSNVCQPFGGSYWNQTQWSQHSCLPVIMVIWTIKGLAHTGEGWLLKAVASTSYTLYYKYFSISICRRSCSWPGLTCLSVCVIWRRRMADIWLTGNSHPNLRLRRWTTKNWLLTSRWPIYC